MLDAEPTSLRTYRRLYIRTRTKDPVTALMAQEYLAAVVRGEEEWERQIGDRAPGMKGRYLSTLVDRARLEIDSGCL